MIEFLAIPASGLPATTLEQWVERFRELGYEASVTRDGSASAWLEVNALRIRGFVVFESGHPEAINFEIHSPDPSTAMPVMEAAVAGLGWELYPDDGEDDD